MKRMRVFAGPNGSSKSTIYEAMAKYFKEYGLINPKRHINPDILNSIDILDFNEYGLTVDENDFKDSLLQSPFYKDCNINIEDLRINNNCFNIPTKNPYIGSILSDYLRDCYIKSEEKLFSFETVFSHPSKVDFLKCANDHGWQVYLYFVSTEDPRINCNRMNSRILSGGHYVPHEKIIERYYRSIENLVPALQHCRRAYIFDSSTTEVALIAEKNPDNSLILHVNPIPAWLNDYVLLKIKKLDTITINY